MTKSTHEQNISVPDNGLPDWLTARDAYASFFVPVQSRGDPAVSRTSLPLLEMAPINGAEFKITCHSASPERVVRVGYDTFGEK